MKLRSKIDNKEFELIDIKHKEERFYLLLEDSLGKVWSRFDSLKELNDNWQDA